MSSRPCRQWVGLASSVLQALEGLASWSHPKRTGPSTDPARHKGRSQSPVELINTVHPGVVLAKVVVD